MLAWITIPYLPKPWVANLHHTHHMPVNPSVCKNKKMVVIQLHISRYRLSVGIGEAPEWNPQICIWSDRMLQTHIGWQQSKQSPTVWNTPITSQQWQEIVTEKLPAVIGSRSNPQTVFELSGKHKGSTDLPTIIQTEWAVIVDAINGCEVRHPRRIRIVPQKRNGHWSTS